MANTYKDIALENYDLAFENGDFKLAISEQQETDLILRVSAGNVFQYPTCGVGITSMLHGDMSAIVLEGIIKAQMVQDGFVVNSINVNGSTINDLKVNIQAQRL